jgi:hypothetical protein
MRVEKRHFGANHHRLVVPASGLIFAFLESWPRRKHLLARAYGDPQPEALFVDIDDDRKEASFHEPMGIRIGIAISSRLAWAAALPGGLANFSSLWGFAAGFSSNLF